MFSFESKPFCLCWFIYLCFSFNFIFRIRNRLLNRYRTHIESFFVLAADISFWNVIFTCYVKIAYRYNFYRQSILNIYHGESTLQHKFSWIINFITDTHTHNIYTISLLVLFFFFNANTLILIILHTKM